MHATPALRRSALGPLPWTLASLLALLHVSCVSKATDQPAASATPQAAPPETEPTTTNVAPLPSEPEPELDDEASALIAAAASDTDAQPNPAIEKGHDVTYRVRQDGLKVEVLDAEFRPQARAVRVRGGWGIELRVDATTTEDLSLLAGEQGPLAIAARVLRPSEQKLVDERVGGQELLLTPERAQTFTRVWPGPGIDPLMAGQEVELRVGLWGLGPSATSRKPLKRFFIVKMVTTSRGGTPVVHPYE